MIKATMKKIHFIFSYIFTFLMLLSLSISFSTYLFSIFLTTFYYKFTSAINTVLLVLLFFSSLYITIKFYIPNTNYYFHENNR